MLLSIIGLVVLILGLIVFGLTGKVLIKSEEFIMRYVALILAEVAIEVWYIFGYLLHK